MGSFWVLIDPIAYPGATLYLVAPEHILDGPFNADIDKARRWCDHSTIHGALRGQPRLRHLLRAEVKIGEGKKVTLRFPRRYVRRRKPQRRAPVTTTT